MSLAIKCDDCGAEAYPAQSMTQDLRLVDSCPSCGHTHPNQKPAPKKAVATVIQITSQQPPSLGPHSDVIGLIKSRLQTLNGELAKVSGYASEWKKLSKMLAAAGETQMKHCETCGWEGEPPEWFCPTCGEASWTDMKAPAASPVEAPASDSPPKASKKAK